LACPVSETDPCYICYICYMPRDSQKSSGLGVAGPLLQAATPRPPVAGCSKPSATRKPAENRHSDPRVANVANVATPPFQPRRGAAWVVSDWRDFYEERAAIRQYEASYSRQEAERLAWGEVVNEWHMTHGDRSRWPTGPHARPASRMTGPSTRR
jgi:hypothetical protein